MADRKLINITIDSDITTRKGVVSDMALISSKDGMSRIDFLLCDIPDEEGHIRSALVSRVAMSNIDLVKLRDMLSDHIARTIDPCEAKTDE